MLLNDTRKDLMLYGADPKGYMDTMSQVYALNYKMMQSDLVKNPPVGSERDEVISAILDHLSLMFTVLTGDGISVDDLRDDVSTLQDMVIELEELTDRYDSREYDEYLRRLSDANDALDEEIFNVVSAFVKKTLPELPAIEMDDIVR